MRTGLSMGGGVTGGLVSLVLFLHFVPLCADATHLRVCAKCTLRVKSAATQVEAALLLPWTATTARYYWCKVL